MKDSRERFRRRRQFKLWVLCLVSAVLLFMFWVLVNQTSETQNHMAGAKTIREHQKSSVLNFLRSTDDGVFKWPDQWTKDTSLYKLSKAMVRSVARNNTVMVTWANLHYQDFVLNWVEQMRRCEIDYYLVGAMDDDLLEALVQDGIHAFAMHSRLATTDFGWGSKTFHKMGREKIKLVYVLLEMQFDVIVSDVDTVWLQDPLPYFQRYPHADILTSSDHLASSVADDGLEDWRYAMSPFNIGIMFLKPAAFQLVKEWYDLLVRDSDIWDQNAFNDLLRQGLNLADMDAGERMFWGFNKTLRVGILPVTTFASGHTFFVQQLSLKFWRKAYVVHATFQFGGTPGKRHRMREELMWKDPPEYFNDKPGFVAIDIKIPPWLLDSAAPSSVDLRLETFKGHFDLVNYQLKQVRIGLALATALGRGFIFPRLWCGVDRWWAPHSGTIPGAVNMTLPFNCPMDHIFDIEFMTGDHVEDIFGPDIPFREHSFVRRAPYQMTFGTVVVNKDLYNSDHVIVNEAGSVMHVAPRLTDKQLRKNLQPFVNKSVIHFSGGSELFGGFDDPQANDRFTRRMSHYSSVWCCINDHPGHVWYDINFDIIPHEDRHNRIWNETWRPTCGP